MNNIVGNILQGLLSKEGAPSKKDFAGMLGISQKTLYNVLDGSSQLTLPQIVKAGRILKFDIAKEYETREFGNEHSIFHESVETFKVKQNLVKMLFTLNIASTIAGYDNFPELLKRTKQAAEELGFIII
jgi:predicted transcriptional regulator